MSNRTANNQIETLKYKYEIILYSSLSSLYNLSFSYPMNIFEMDNDQNINEIRFLSF